MKIKQNYEMLGMIVYIYIYAFSNKKLNWKFNYSFYRENYSIHILNKLT